MKSRISAEILILPILLQWELNVPVHATKSPGVVNENEKRTKCCWVIKKDIDRVRMLFERAMKWSAKRFISRTSYEEVQN
jgi:hypothetical protein